MPKYRQKIEILIDTVNFREHRRSNLPSAYGASRFPP